MQRLLGILVVSALLAFFAVACAGDDGTATSDEQGVRVVAAPDQAAFRASVTGRGIVQETCGYDRERNVADCGERGVFTPEPGPDSEDASCVVGIPGSATTGAVDIQYLLCSSPTTGQSTFYAIEAASPAGS
jgi:hypothetical protein